MRNREKTSDHLYGYCAYLVMTALIIMSGIGHAWYDTNATVRQNITVNDSVLGIPYPIITTVTDSDPQWAYFVVNGTDNGVEKYHVENNTGNVTVIWAVNSTASPWLYTNWTGSPGDNGTRYEVFDNDFVYAFHMDYNTSTMPNYRPNLNGSSMSGMIWTNSGYYGSGVYQPSANTGITITNGKGAQFGQSFTFEGWVKILNSESMGMIGLDTDCGIILNYGGLGKIRSLCYGDVNNFDNYASPVSAGFSTNEWFYVALTYDGTTAMLYYNGVNVLNQTASNAMPTATKTIYLGYVNSGGVGGLVGYLDETRISNVTRSAGYVRSVWNNRNGAHLGGNETRGAGTPPVTPPGNATGGTTSGSTANLYLWLIVFILAVIITALMALR